MSAPQNIERLEHRYEEPLYLELPAAGEEQQRILARIVFTDITDPLTQWMANILHR
jgi:hypothetical protein